MIIGGNGEGVGVEVGERLRITKDRVLVEIEENETEENRSLVRVKKDVEVEETAATDIIDHRAAARGLGVPAKIVKTLR